SYLLGWREIYPWLSLQVLPLVAYWTYRGDPLSHGWPIFVCTTVFVLHVGPAQTWYAYRLADPEIKQHRRWFWAYLVFATLFYTEYTNTIARVSHIKEWVGERSWKVTPRGDSPTGVPTFASIDVGDEPSHRSVHTDLDAASADRGDRTDGSGARVPARVAEVDDRDALDRELDELLASSGAGATDSSRGPEPVGAASSRDESSRLHGAVAGLVPTHGLAGEPLLPRRSPGRAARLSFGRDEPFLSQRARSLVEPTSPPTPPVGEPLLVRVAPRPVRSQITVHPPDRIELEVT
ncbi:MAG: hypothetical protein ACLGHQ_13390, partial [Acidimicrobiia bacterium]